VSLSMGAGDPEKSIEEARLLARALRPR
jgi:hypothetical protein